MQSSRAAATVSARFDDPNLVAYGGLEPVVRLAEWYGLPALTEELVRLPVSKDGTGAFPAAKVISLVSGMVAGADSIDDMVEAAARRTAPSVRRGAGPVHAGSVSAFLHARACQATSRRGPPLVSPPGLVPP